MRALPAGSPHHLDNVDEVYPAPHVALKRMQIMVGGVPGHEMSIIRDGRQMFLTVPHNLVPQLSDAVEVSIRDGYIWENFARISMLDEHGTIRPRKIYFWSCAADNSVIFY